MGNTTRREFLGQGLTAAALTGLGASTFMVGKSSAAGAPNSPRIGIIGCGGQGCYNMGVIVRHVVAVADPDLSHVANAVKIADKAGLHVDTYQDFRRMLDRDDIDGVLISTPDHWHALAMILSCQAGKDVYCEKPLTRQLDEGKAMVKAARRYGRVVQTGSQQRSSGEFRQAVELVRNGYLGKITQVEVGIPNANYGGKDVPGAPIPEGFDYDLWLGPAEWRPYNPRYVHYNFRFFWCFAGGQMTNWGAHHLDITQWALDKDGSGPVKISGSPTMKPEQPWEVPFEVDVNYEYADGTPVHLATHNRSGVTFKGTKGTLYVNRGHIEASDKDILRLNTREFPIQVSYSREHHQNWFECMATRKKPICDVEIGHRSVSMCHLGNIAMRTGHTLEWDPVKETIVGDPEAAKLLTYDYRLPYFMPTI